MAVSLKSGLELTDTLVTGYAPFVDLNELLSKIALSNGQKISSFDQLKLKRVMALEQLVVVCLLSISLGETG